MTRAERGPPPGVLALLALVGGVLTAVAMSLAVVEAPEERWLPAAVLRGAVVAAPIGVGLLALRWRASDRFAWLLVGTGVLFFFTALAESRNPELYGTGRIMAWFIEPVLAYLMLSFPSGRLRGTAERAIVGAMAAVLTLLYLPSALTDQRYPEPSAWSTCADDCPSNPFAVTDATPAFMHDLVKPVREVLIVLLFLAVVWALTRRARRGGPLLRRALAPLIFVAVVRGIALAVYFPARADGDVDTLVQALGWVWAMALPLLALSFGAGLVVRRLHAASSLRQLALHTHTNLDEARVMMADALEDPSLRLFFRDDEAGAHWIDDAGAEAARPGDGNGRRVTEVRADDGRHTMAVVHDEALGQDPRLVEIAASYALVAVENASLVDQLRASVSDLADSRSRLIESTDEARRSIERDLHDGGQQRLTALRVRIAIAAEHLEGVSPDEAARVRLLGDDVDEAIDEIRRLARGIYPSVLADQGLAAALRAAARSSPVPVTVDVGGLDRMRPDIERTLYFACTEALQNAVKHAGATSILVRVRRAGPEVSFEVRDDGAGFDVTRRNGGSGLPNLADRIAAAGGAVLVESQPGSGTAISGSVPG